MMLEKEFAGNIISVGYVGNMASNMNRVIPNGNLPEPPLSAGGCGVTTTISLPHPCQPYYSKIPLVNSLTNYNVARRRAQLQRAAGKLRAALQQGLDDILQLQLGEIAEQYGHPQRRVQRLQPVAEPVRVV